MARERSIGTVIIISGVVFLAYWNSLGNGFVYDDVYFVRESPLIRDLSNVPKMFTSAVWEFSSVPGTQRYYRPLLLLSYGLNFSLWGFNPLGYHLLNVLLHVSNTLLAFRMVFLLSGRIILAATVALLFGLHPLNTEAVAWVSAVNDPLATFFALGSLVLYIQAFRPQDSNNFSPERVRLLWILSLASFLLGLFAKESAVSILGVLIVYELAFRPLLPKKWLRLTPYVVLLMLYLGWRLAVVGWPAAESIYFVHNPLVDEPALPRFLTGIKILGKYLWLLFMPLQLAVDYSFNQIPVARSFWDFSIIVPGIVLFGLIGTALLSWKRNPLVFFGLGVFFTTASLVFLNALFPYGEIMAERYIYLPSVGFISASVGLAYAGTRLLPERWRAVVVITLLSAVLVFYFAKTRRRNLDWRDNFSLFHSAVEVNNNSAMNHFMLAVEYYDKGQINLARSHYKKALAIYPSYAHAYLGLGSLALAEENYKEAVIYLWKSVQLLPNFFQTHMLLGEAYRGLGRLDEAQRETEAALKLNPQNPGIYNNLGNILSQRGDFSGALSLWHKAVDMDPFLFEGFYNLANLYEKMGQGKKANFYYEKFLALAPERLDDIKTRVRAKLSK